MTTKEIIAAKARVEVLDSEIRVRLDERTKLRVRLDAHNSKFKVGDTIQWGRNRVVKGQVERVIIENRYLVRRIRKDGSLGHSSVVYEWENATKV